MSNGPRKLGKKDTRKSKILDLDDLKDKTIGITDKNRDKINSWGRSSDFSQKEFPPKLEKPDRGDQTLSFDKLRDIPGFKDKKFVLAVIAIIIIVLIGVFASFTPTTNQTNNNTSNVTPEPQVNTFNNSAISFNYPEGWNATNGNDAPVIVTVSRDENNSFVVMSEKLNTSFAERALLWRQNIQQSGEINYESNITIDNTTGYNVEASYNINNTNYNVRGVAVAKNDTIYFVMFIFNKSLLDYKDEMDMVINSFHIINKE